MGRSPSATGPRDLARWQRTLEEFRSVGQMDVAFSAEVSADASTLEITGTSGAATRVLEGVRIDAGHGLGGKALVLGRPASVQRYVAARGITHQYDRLVQVERLETMTALPVVVAGAPRLMVYVAHRRPVLLGDVWYGAFLPLVRRTERDLLAEDQVAHRLDQLRREAQRHSAPRSEAERTLRDIVDELADIAALTTDDALRARLESVRRRAHGGCGAPPTVPPGAGATLAAGLRLGGREIDVLRQIALGQTNRQAAEALGIVESTAKTYLKSAMRKLQATNRVHAVRLAREAGVIA